ncbi:MAG TPA: NAD(+) diphosphatase [Streptosporangiaceae bacterium]|nr:NAD(+) diphosphatase [Streptosporangiaceae bacterium]
MTSTGARGRETVLAYSGGTIDRASNKRTDAAFLDATLAAPGARLIPMWRDRCIVSGEPAVPAILPVAGAGRVLEASAETVFLGLDEGGGLFAADLSPLEESDAVGLAGGEQALDVRGFVGTLTPPEAAVLGYARGMLYWHRHQQFCGTCGSRTASGHGGHLRSCQGCERLHFPRVEPAVIMLVETSQPPRRCLLARHRGSAPDGFSTLAGFVDVSESLEDAVRREVAEETGVVVETVTYVASQGWPFPSGLMVGFRATAVTEAVTVDGEEVLQARWFTRAELVDLAASRGRLGREDSIGRYLLRSWLAETS